jgi:C-terminal processing protease CtpA/Prc
MEIGQKDEVLTVICTTLKGTPAERAGIKDR